MYSKYRLFPVLGSLIALVAVTFASPVARAIDLTGGLMKAVPAPNGSPALDGTDIGWDLTAAEPMWVSPQTVQKMHAMLALDYDATNIYVYARISLDRGKLHNPNGPADPFWGGDMLELRLSSDPSLPFPLEPNNPKVEPSDRVCHLSFWKNTLDGKIYLNIAYGGMHGNGKGKVVNPPGSQVAVTEGTDDYVIQAKVPWSVLRVPDGKNPYPPGSRMTALWGVHWGGENQFAALYTRNPGAFGFINWGSWGQIEFSPTGNLKPVHGTMEEALAKAASAKAVGVPITIDVPEAGKLSVNIIGEHGDILRDVAGGESVTAGKKTVYWDGHDQRGFPVPPGTYHWGAYFSHGLKARYLGSVGVSNHGSWGGDHSAPDAVAADASGIYFGWAVAEAQAQLVKIDYNGNVLWRKTPFVGGGFADLRALASNGKYLFGAYNGVHPILSRLDPSQGVYALFGNDVINGGSVPISSADPIKGPPDSLPAYACMNQDGTVANCLGLAATANEVFASIYSQNIIQVLDVETGKPTRTLPCPRPLGLTLDAKGNLYAVSYGTDQPPEVVRFDGVNGKPSVVVSEGLVAPLGVAVDASGQITVTDGGASQQVKTFSADGKLIRTLGKEGGRAYAGTYNPSGYRDPSAITADAQGGLDFAESAIPKIFNRIDAASGKNIGRWFGGASYGVSNIGDSDDPMTSYYPFEPAGFARATLSPSGGESYPTASWDMEKAGYGKMYSMLPYIRRLDNGKKYFIDDWNPHSVCLIEGDNILPVGHLEVHYPYNRKHPEDKTNFIQMWIDKNGDHQPQSDEITTITTVDGKPLPRMMDSTGSLWIDKDGTAYIICVMNSILKIPSDGFDKNGNILWNADKATFVVPSVIPSLFKSGLGGRMGMPGMRTDSKGDIFACLSIQVPTLTPELEAKIKAAFPDLPQSEWGAYANAAIAKHMQEGLGHTGESNVAKFAAYGPDGKMLWIAGRKATSAPNPGEMYHFWAMAGIVNDDYVAGASEWGPIYFYTTDGYYVDSLMYDPATLPPYGPYTFGSETFAGRIETYDKLGKVFAYDQGGIYAVDGFDNKLKVEGERRLSGTVQLDNVYESAEAPAVAESLQIVPVTGDIAQDATWSSAPSATLTRASNPLATAQIGYDSDNVYARIHVVDDTPLQNGSDDDNVVFKHGDVVGLDLGPAGDREAPVLGDLRILAANVHGQAHLIGMKPLSKQPKQPQQYTTPASGTKLFDFVGDIPGGKVTLTPDADGHGYTAWMTVPRSFLEFPIAPGAKLKGDVEVLLSGTGLRGLQTVSRNWLYSGGRSQTTMVDDIPTEAWLYPQYWGEINLK